MTTTLTPPTVAEGTQPVALRLRVVESSQTEEALALWRELEQQIGTVPLTASEAWTRTWVKHYGDTVRYRFLIAESSDADRSDPHLNMGLRSKSTCGIALVTETEEPKAPLLKLSTRHLGTAGDPRSEGVVVEYNSLLADPSHRPLFVRAVANWLTTEAGAMSSASMGSLRMTQPRSRATGAPSRSVSGNRSISISMPFEPVEAI